MKKILLSMLAVVFAFSAMAQDSKKSEQNIQKEGRSYNRKHGQNPQRFESMAQKLSLSEDQKNRMKTLNETFSQQMKELNKNENITVKEQKDRRQALVNQHQTQVDAILTAEQKSKMHELRDRTYSGMGQKRGMNKGDRMDRMKGLDLNDEQQKHMKTINEDLQSKMQGIQNNNGLTDTEKKDQINSLKKKHFDDIRSILTPEQKEKLKETGKKGNRNKTV